MADEKLKLEDLLGNVQRIDEEGRIDTVAIIGGGIMGQGIAQTVAAAGLDVILIEIDEEKLNAALSSLKAGMEREIARWAMTSSEMKSILNRIKGALDFKDVPNCDLVIEAVDENYDVKKKIFTELDKLAQVNTIFVSNTSTLSLTKIADVTNRPDRVLGMHFLNPVPKIPLVELIRGLETSTKTVERMKAFAYRLGKTAVEVYEYPGFVTTRAIVPLLNEAMHILLEGVATAKDIDTAMKLGYGFNVGPLEMADSMGLDEVLAWMESLWASLGEPRYRPCPILRKLVRDRKLGKKTGEGFFKYDANGKIIY